MKLVFVGIFLQEGADNPDALTSQLVLHKLFGLRQDILVKPAADIFLFVVMVIDNENDQVPKGRLVNALARTGDEGRDTLR